MESKRAKELAEAHWNGYVGPLTEILLVKKEYTRDEVMDMCQFNYTSSHIHGFKHGVESERAGEFRPRIGQHPPAHPYYHKDELPLSPEEVKAINEAVSPPSLCGTCIRQGCPEDCAEHTTECGEYLPQGIGSEPAQSKQWTHEPEAVTLSLALPSITVEGGLEEVRKKCEEEAKEWGQCTVGSINSAVEAWDFVQARQTFSERGGDPISLRCGDIIGDLQCMRKDNPDMVEAAKRAVLIKNACRTRPDGGTGYYAPKVCDKIILSGGNEW